MLGISAAYPQTNQTPSGGFYRNPILGGDYPDPSVLRVGKDYYLTHSSFLYYPGLLVWHSTDLIHWERVSHALTKYVGSVWAPDLVKFKDTFYIYFPAGGTIWVVSAASPAGPWSAPVDLHLPRFIDPGHIAAPNGKRYLYLSGGSYVQLADDGLSTVGSPQHVYDGWKYPEEWNVEGFCLESPKSLVKDGYFYQTVAEGGTAGPATSHMVVSARAKSLDGPWENSPQNPILRTQSRSERWWSQGHGTVFDDADGKWWMIYHGYENGFHTLGRQTLMLPVEWTPDGWFRIPENTRSSDALPKPSGQPSTSGVGLSDDFSGDQLGLQWQFYKNFSPERTKVQNGELILQAEGNSFTNSAPLLVNPGDKKYEIQVEVTLTGDTTAGVCVFYDERAKAWWGCSTNKTVSGYLDFKSVFNRSPGNSFFLRLVNDANEVNFYFSPDGKRWTKSGKTVDVSGYHHNNFGGFLSLRAGVFAFGSGEAKFRNFVYVPL